MADKATKSKSKGACELQRGETRRANGTYAYQWKDRSGKRHIVYGKTLPELRAKEQEIQDGIRDNIKPEARSVTINNMYER